MGDGVEFTDDNEKAGLKTELLRCMNTTVQWFWEYSYGGRNHIFSVGFLTSSVKELHVALNEVVSVFEV